MKPLKFLLFLRFLLCFVFFHLPLFPIPVHGMHYFSHLCPWEQGVTENIFSLLGWCSVGDCCHVIQEKIPHHSKGALQGKRVCMFLSRCLRRWRMRWGVSRGLGRCLRSLRRWKWDCWRWSRVCPRFQQPWNFFITMLVLFIGLYHLRLCSLFQVELGNSVDLALQFHHIRHRMI